MVSWGPASCTVLQASKVFCISECPNFIALNAAHFQITNHLVVILCASAAQIPQQIEDCMFSYSRHAAGGIDGSPFSEGCYYLGAFVSFETVHNVRQSPRLRLCYNNIII